MLQLHRLVSDTISLLFPALCQACGTNLYRGEKEICTQCLYTLPYTDYHSYASNRVAKQLWGRLPCHAAMSMLYFRKGLKVQHLMHSLKYKNRTEIGLILGRLLGTRLQLSAQYEDIDLIIPVPLALKKEQQRGYNQSKYIADGIAAALHIPVSVVHLSRNKETASQTKKSRYTRYENMKDAFKVSQATTLKGKHILLVDDVMTTGATLEACGLALLDSGIKKLSIATLAFAE